MGIGAVAKGVLLTLVLVGQPLLAQEAPARLDPAESWIDDRWRGIELSLVLSRAVPWRVFTLDSPRRLVVEVRGVDWAGVETDSLLLGDNATGLTLGEGTSGWARLEVELGRALAVTEAGMTVAEGGSSARLHLVLEVTDDESFAASAAAPPSQEPALASPPAAPPADGTFVVAIDPGHGGVDPGAERAGLKEADLMLALAEELAEALEGAGVVPVLTREEDSFVPLQERMTLARAAGADVLVSLHADALKEEDASGASVYTLTDEAVGEASGKMVERHQGSDLLAGLDLRGEDDAVATALMDLARAGTVPASRRLAQALARELPKAGAALNDHALRQAPLAVLNAADFPSVLLETGFLSDAGDRGRLSTPGGRAPIVRGIVAALTRWAAEEAGRPEPLTR
ncbi:N-acetylmuramoyl-L-alanine amidase [Rubellimicrobium mesophilum DSM 19309]|uniref:N-acetylmuramoyl-L-alanine amidase n=1 Tax=Rubellimicrobium mesophilum DSM 19309 TaxID=442562 RepID=A0A017HN37_9RHOB|nr:N-acetylmuramoyl-L-alanine amidase [Rubellimicrobium mesophilum]EYD75796.1 N-acetylmuramoyl-L-alanine amidase [Rubellimicrobium mesophilum DSM 19309]